MIENDFFVLYYSCMRGVHVSQRLNILGIAWFSYTRLYDFETKPDKVQAMDIQVETTCIIIQVDTLIYDQGNL